MAARHRGGSVPLSATPASAPAAQLPVRAATAAELDVDTLYRILRLRVDVFVVEQACPYPELDGRDLEPSTRHCWIADDRGEVLAYLRVLAEAGGGSRIGRVVTAGHARGRGTAARLLRHGLALAGRPVLIDAQSHLAGWYERFGFGVCGPEHLQDGIPHLPMSLPSPPPSASPLAPAASGAAAAAAPVRSSATAPHPAGQAPSGRP
jgi:ElaA protein